jgi:hypothetical protein
MSICLRVFYKSLVVLRKELVLFGIPVDHGHYSHLESAIHSRAQVSRGHDGDAVLI